MGATLERQSNSGKGDSQNGQRSFQHRLEIQMKYYLEINENGHRIPTGNTLGYATLKEAKDAAKKKVDDALPNNSVSIMLHITSAYMRGDGGEYFADEAD
jgi:hypothetical protein